MKIDLNDIPFGFETFYEMRKLQSGVLFREICVINSKMERKYNYIIIPIEIFDIIKLHDRFKFPQPNDVSEGINKVGMIDTFEVFLDPYHPKDQITLWYDKQISRDIKIESILENSELNNIVKVKY